MGRRTKDRSNTQYYVNNNNTPKYSTLADIFRSNNHNDSNSNGNLFMSTRARTQVVNNMSTNYDRPSTNYSQYSNKDNINNNNKEYKNNNKDYNNKNKEYNDNNNNN